MSLSLFSCCSCFRTFRSKQRKGKYMFSFSVSEKKRTALIDEALQVAWFRLNRVVSLRNSFLVKLWIYCRIYDKPFFISKFKSPLSLFGLFFTVHYFFWQSLSIPKICVRQVHKLIHFLMLSLVENYLFPCISSLFFLPLSCPLFYLFFNWQIPAAVKEEKQLPYSPFSNPLCFLFTFLNAHCACFASKQRHRRLLLCSLTNCESKKTPQRTNLTFLCHFSPHSHAGLRCIFELHFVK